MYGSVEAASAPGQYEAPMVHLDAAYEPMDLLSLPTHPASAATIALSLILMMIGGGVLALPEAAHSASLLVALALLALVALLMIVTARLVVLGCALARSPSYSCVVATVLYGPIDECRYDECSAEQMLQHRRMRHRRSVFMGIVDVMLCCYVFMGVVVYTRMIADASARIAHHAGAGAPFDDPAIFYALVFAFGTVTGMLRSFQEMKVIIIAGVLTVAAVITTIVVCYLRHGGSDFSASRARDRVRWFDIDEGCMWALTTIIYAFMCHNIIPQVYHELPAPSPPVFSRPVALSMIITMVLYALAMTCGYLTFGADVGLPSVGGNILNNYPENAVWTSMRIMFITHLLCVIPPRIVNLRVTLNRLRTRARSSERSSAAASEASLLWRAGFAITFSAASCLVAWVAPGVGTLTRLIGAFIGVPIVSVPFVIGFAIYSGMWQGSQAAIGTGCGELYLPRRDAQVGCLLGVVLSLALVTFAALTAAGVFTPVQEVSP
jgi:amino acid permease